MKSVCIHAQIEVVENTLDDLAESQRHNGQIVAVEPQDGDADQHAGNGGKYGADHHGNSQTQGHRGDGIL